MRGLVISISVSITIGGPAMGALLIGWLAELVGLQWAVAASSLTALAAILCLLPAIYRRRFEMEAV